MIKDKCPINDDHHDVSSCLAVDVQAEFAMIKDALSKMKMPANLELNEQKQGFKRAGQQALQILSRSGQYVGTSLKLLMTPSPPKEVAVKDYRHLYFFQ